MKAASWGTDRISQELALKLGVVHSAATIRRYLHRARGPSRDSWRAFVARHAAALVAIDFTVVHLWQGAAVYVLVVLAVDTREVLWIAVTRQPGLDWVKTQLRAVLENFPGRTWVLHDNDGIFGQYWRSRPHQGLGGIPDEAHEPRGPPEVRPGEGRLVRDPVLGGIQHDYRLVA